MSRPTVAVAALWVTLLGTGWLASAPADAAPTDVVRTPALPAQSADATDATLQLVDQQFAVDPNGDIRLDYLLTGLVGDPLELVPPPPPPEPEPPTPTEPVDPAAPPAPPPPPPPEPEPPVELTVEITNYEALTDPAAVAAVVGAGLDPEAAGAVGRAIDGVALDARPLLVRNDDGTAAMELVVGTDVSDSVRDRLKFERPGLYPVRVQLLIGDPADDNVVATASTVVQRLAGAVDFGVTAAPPIDLSVIAVTPPAAPNATADELDDARAELDQALDLTTEIDAPLTIEVAPTLIAEQVASPDGADRLARALVDDELVALPLVPLDVSSAVAVGQGDSYTRLVRAGEDLLTEAAPTVPSVRSVWIAADPLSGAGAQHLRDLGARVVIMTEELFAENVVGGGEDGSAISPPTGLFVEAGLPDGGTIALLVVDPISAELTEAAADTILAEATATEWGVATLARMLVEQSVDDTASGGPTMRRSRVLSTPQLRSPDPRLLQSLEQLATTTTAVRFTSASALIGVTDALVDGGEPVRVQLPDSAGPDLAPRVELLDATSASMASVATMLPADDPRPAAWQRQIDLLISTAYTDAEVEATTDDLLDEAAALKSAVQLPEPFTFTLTGRSGSIEVRLVNTADEPLDVVVELTSQKVDFPEGPQQVTLRPLDETSVVVPVDAQSNGTSSIALQVSTPAGEQLGGEVDLTARVTALTGLGQVLTGGLIAVILTWWFSHWRSRRRAALLEGRGRHPSSTELESGTL